MRISSFHSHITLRLLSIRLRYRECAINSHFAYKIVMHFLHETFQVRYYLSIRFDYFIISKYQVNFFFLTLMKKVINKYETVLYNI